MKKLMSLILVLMMVLAVSSVSFAEEDQFKVGILAIDLSIEAYASISGYFSGYAEEAGWLCTVVSCNYDSATQLKQMEDFTAAGYDCLLIFQPADPVGIVSGVRDAMEAGVVVISYGTPIDLDDSELVCDNYNAMFECGNQVQAWIEANKEPGETAKFGMLIIELNSQSAWDRYNGVLDNLKELIDAGRIEIVAEQVTQTHAEGMQLAETLLTQYPDLDGFICCSGGAAAGANEAVRAAGKVGQCFVFGTDATADILNILRSDNSAYYCTICVGSDTYMAQKLFEMCEIVKAGEADTLEDVYLAPYEVVTSENVEDYITRWGLTV